MENSKLIAFDFSGLESASVPNLAGGSIGDIVNKVLLLIFPLAGIIVFFYLIYGGYQYLISQNDPKSVAAAKQTITYAVIGFLVMFAAYFIVQFAGLTLSLPAIANMF